MERSNEVYLEAYPLPCIHQENIIFVVERFILHPTFAVNLSFVQLSNVKSLSHRSIVKKLSN